MFISAGMLARNKSQPCRELTSVPKHLAIRNGRHHRRCDQWSHTFNRSDLQALFVVLEYPLNPLFHSLNTLV